MTAHDAPTRRRTRDPAGRPADAERAARPAPPQQQSPTCRTAGAVDRRAHPRSNRRARRPDRLARRRLRARRSAAVSRPQGHARARRALARRQRARALGIPVRIAKRRRRRRAESSRDVSHARATSTARQPGQDELVVTLDWVGDGQISAQQDLHVPARPVRGRSHADGHADGGRQLARRAVRADGARARARRAVVLVASTRTRSKGPCSTTATEFEKLKFDELAKTPVDADSVTAAGSPRFSTTSSRRPCRRPGRLRYDASDARPGVRSLSAIGPVDRRRRRRCRSTATFKLFVGPKLQAAAAERRQRARAHRRLRRSHAARAAAVLRARVGCTAGSATGAWRSSSSRS